MRRGTMVLALSACLGACGGRRDLVLAGAANWEAHVYDSGRNAEEMLGALVFRQKVCEGQSLAPEYELLDETALLKFLQARNVTVSLERPRTDLAYLTIDERRTRKPARLRVAILENADQAGRELAEALAQHGQGAWGVHRSNLAVLGPVGEPTHDLAFAAELGLACWGVFTIRGQHDTFVIPGAYREI